MAKSMLRYYAARYHAFDWILLAIMCVIVTVIYESKMPFCRPFLWIDATISFPSREDTFPNYSLLLMIIFGLLFIFFCLLYVVRPVRGWLPEPLSCCGLLPRDYTSYYNRLRREAVGNDGIIDNNGNNVASGGYDDAEDAEELIGGISSEGNRAVQGTRGPIFSWVLMYLWGVGLQLLLVQLLKTYTGRLRPDYLSRLAKVNYTPSTYHLNSNFANNHTLPDPMHEMEFYCGLMETHTALKEGRLSFPSGHSSISFSVATLLYFFLAAHLRPYARQGSFARLIVCMSPFSFALICATSRTRDYKHNHSDIFAGALIGIWSSWMAFHMAFREAGGAAALYLARSDRDVELQLFQRQIQVQNGSNASGSSNIDNNNNNNKTTAVAVYDNGARRGGGFTVSNYYNNERGLNEDSTAVQWI